MNLDKEIIYLDNNATTKLDPTILEVMLPYLTDLYGNPSSNHIAGKISKDAVIDARIHLSNLIGCEMNEIYFTSGATEAINIALQGIVDLSKKTKPHIITVVTEHPAVIETCKYLELLGVEITYLPVNSDGLIDIPTFKNSFKQNTILASVMSVNNETGVIQPIYELADITHFNNAIFMTDATQAIGRIPINVKEGNIDILCISGHKFYGPKGIGALYIRSKGKHKVPLNPLFHGGGQENGLRSGTLNVASIVGLGKAAEIALLQFKAESIKIKKLRDKLEKGLLKLPNTFVNGNINQRAHNVSSICFENTDADAIMIGMKNILVSNGSACSSNSIEPSHVLKSMGKSDMQSFSTIRFSVGRFNTEDEINKTIKIVSDIVTDLRQLN